MRSRRPTCPEVLRPALNQKIEKYIRSGWWEFRNVQNASPMLCVFKKTDELRTVIDARQRNSNTIPDVTPMPDQDVIRQDCAAAKYRSKIDLTNAFEQLRIVEKDVHKSAFTTIQGTMVSNVGQQGDCNMPSSFQRLMVRIFRNHLGVFVHVYLDDIFVYSKTISEHERHLDIAFDILRKAHLYCAENKLDLYSEKMDCLGHIIDSEGIHASADKMRTVRDWIRPQSYNDVQRFLGLVNYISHFMPDCSAYTSPLSAMSRQRDWSWNPIHQSSFQRIKDLACKAPILRPIDWSIIHLPHGKVWVICDASISGIGAYYGQGEDWKTCRPAGFLSKKFSQAQLSYFTYEQETIAILEAFKLWEDKLMGRPFTTVTDHKTLQFFATQPTLSRRQIRWSEYLSRFNHTMMYVEGSSNIVADAFSRYYSTVSDDVEIPIEDYVTIDSRLDPDGDELPTGLLAEVTARSAAMRLRKRTPVTAVEPRDAELEALHRFAPTNEQPVATVTPDTAVPEMNVWEAGTHTQPLIVTELGTKFSNVIREGYIQDPLLSKILTKPDDHPRFKIDQHGLIRTQNAIGDAVICIPNALFKGRRVTEIIIDNAHRTIGHHQLRKTSQYIRRWYWWPTIVKDLESFCKSCGLCQTTKTSTQRPKGLLHSMPIPNRPWQSIGMDFVGPFPESEGFNYLLVAICRLSGMIRLLRCRTTSTASDIAALYLNEIIRLFGTPESIVSDRDSKFISLFWQELNRLMGTKLLMSTAYHPQTDGMSEFGVKKITAVLRTVVDADQSNWSSKIPLTEFAVNSTNSSSTGFAPFEVGMGWLPRINFLPDTTPFMGVQSFVDQAMMNVSAAHDGLIASRVYQTHQANKHRDIDPVLAVGDRVYLSTANLNLPKGRARKLMPKFIGPYRITLALPATSNYELELPPQLKARGIHKRFHISRLREHVPNDDEKFPNREIETYYDFGNDPETEWLVSQIRAHKWVNKSIHFEIVWDSGEVTWEPLKNINKLSLLDDYLVTHGVSEPSELPRKK